MSLPHALLTALIERPCSGSDLASRFDRSIGHFWHASHQQIYRELGRLEQAGWVASQALEGSRGSKRNYRVLPAGRKELRRWVALQEDPQPLRDELMVRLRAEAAIGHSAPTGLRQEVARRLAWHQDKLDLFLRIEANDFSAPKPTRETQLQHLVLQAGIQHERLWVDFARRALQVLDLPPDPPDLKPTAKPRA
jgi:DNA-binding PadR family transcriptional regulator